MERLPSLTTTLALLAIGLAACQDSGGTADKEPTRQGASALTAKAPTMFWSARWGSGPGELGHKLDPESAPEGPMSLATDLEGRLFVLDQVNRRVQVLTEGAQLAAVIPIGSDTVQDLTVLDDGTLVLLDRLRERSLTFLSPSGAELARVPIEGNGVAEGGGVTGLAAFEGGVWVEVEGQTLVRVADHRGRPDRDRPAVDGRPTRRDGEYWRASLPENARRTAQLDRADRSGRLISRRKVQFDLPIRHLSLQTSDARGRLFLGAHLERLEEGRVAHEKESLLVLSQAGELLAKADFDPTRGPEEQVRTFAVSPRGVVYHLRCASEGVEIRRWQP